MIIDACNNIVNISDNDKYNTENYISSLKHIKNLHLFIQELRNTGLNMKEIKFLPSYKDSELAKKLCLDIVNIKETNLQLFKVKSKLFVGDKELVQKIKNYMIESICEEVILFEDNTLIFKLDSKKLEKKLNKID